MRVRAAGALALAAAVALLAAGCSTQASGAGSSVTVSGRSLHIYISDPPQVQSDPSLQDVVDAAQLAFDEQHAIVTRYAVALRTLRHRLVSDNARAAIRDPSAIAYIGEIEPGASVQTAGITEALDLLQLSPTDPTGIPDGDYEELSTYGRTFAHVAQKLPSVPGFAGRFATAYHHPPAADAVYGYQAMSLLLGELRSLGAGANDRAAVVRAVRKQTLG